jgi:aspartyl-tRNA(Asn)/glutamyl-tRNA(Gln) amidotransferase subunit C
VERSRAGLDRLQARRYLTTLDFSARALVFARSLQRRTSMKITREQVDYVALLGRLELEPEEKEKYMGQLDDILKYMDMLAEVPTDDVEPMAGPVELYTPLREDEVKPSLREQEALANAPDRDGTSFRVPKVIE